MEDEFDEPEESTERFPRSNLESAIDIADKVVKCGYSASVAQIAGMNDQSTRSGAFRMRMSAATQFGLISPGRGRVAITDLGKRVTDPDTMRNARVEAFLNVPLYQKLFQKFETGKLPPAQGIDSVLFHLGVRSNNCELARRIFLTSAEQAGFMAHGRDRLVLPPSGPPGEVGVQSASRTEHAQATSREVHPLIDGLLALLPSDRRMTKAEFERWMKAFRINAELVYLNDLTEASNEGTDD